MAVTEDDMTKLVDLVESELSAACDKAALVDPLGSAVRYALFPGGKRIRPLLSLALCCDLGADPSQMASPAAALELVHCASLIHDDLPAVDNDDLRRGKPSCHKAFGEATAILAADAMLPMAFAEVAAYGGSPLAGMKMAAVLARSFTDLCSGQQLDLLPPERRGSVKRIHQLKTGALFGAALEFAALHAGLPDPACRAAFELGSDIGVLFQFVDDYLDRFGDERDKGRPKGSDERNRKITFFSDGDTNSADSKADCAFLRQKIESGFGRLNESAGRPFISGCPMSRSLVERIAVIC